MGLVDSAGVAFAAYRYDAFGVPLSVTSTATARVPASLAQEITARQVLRYAGYVWDAESGLYALGARSYDPYTAQFTSRDPMRADGEESPYQYCGGDPVGAVDPSGMIADWSGEGRATVLNAVVHTYHNTRSKHRRAHLWKRMLAEERRERRRYAHKMRHRERRYAAAVRASQAAAAAAAGEAAGWGAATIGAGVVSLGCITIAGSYLAGPGGPAFAAWLYSNGMGAAIGLGGSAGAAAALREAGDGDGDEAQVVNGVREAFHHTTDKAARSIMESGLRPGSYATPDRLDPVQAQRLLALDPAAGPRSAILRVDLGSLKAAGYRIPSVTTVQPRFGMPGGGLEMQFPYRVPEEFLRRIQ